MWRCEKCGRKIEAGEFKKKSSYLAEAWGHSVYEDCDVCPDCGYDEFEEIIAIDFYEDEILEGEEYYELPMEDGEVIIKKENIEDFLSNYLVK